MHFSEQTIICTFPTNYTAPKRTLNRSYIQYVQLFAVALFAAKESAKNIMNDKKVQLIQRHSPCRTVFGNKQLQLPK